MSLKYEVNFIRILVNFDNDNMLDLVLKMILNYLFFRYVEIKFPRSLGFSSLSKAAAVRDWSIHGLPSNTFSAESSVSTSKLSLKVY